MSSLWTPSGERPVAPEPPAGEPSEPSGGEEQAGHGGLTDEELAALRDVHTRIRATPAAAIVANHAVQLFELALVYLGVGSPPDEQGRPPVADLTQAGLAIDAMAALVDGLGPRLAEHEATLRDGLAQIQLLYARTADAAG